MACRIQGSNLCSLKWKHGAIATGLSGNSLQYYSLLVCWRVNGIRILKIYFPEQRCLLIVNIVEGVRLKSPPWQEWSGWFYMEQDKFKSSFRNKDHLTECICCSLLGEEGLNIFILLFVSKLEWNPSAVSFFLEFKACYSFQSLRIPEVSAWELLSSRSQGEGREVGS